LDAERFLDAMETAKPGLISITVIACNLLDFEECRQSFIRSPNETLSVAAMRVCNPDCSPVGINR
jgi:hypothetical protein